jgi:hypothetical protein
MRLSNGFGAAHAAKKRKPVHGRERAFVIIVATAAKQRPNMATITSSILRKIEQAAPERHSRQEEPCA